MRLAELLVKKGVASARQIEEAIAKQVVHGGDLASHLLEQVGADNEATLMAVVAEHAGLHPAPSGALPRPADRVLKLLPSDIAQRHRLYPLAVDGGALVVAVSERLPEQVEDDLSFALGLPIVQLVAPEVRIAQGLSRDYRAPLDRRSTRLLAKLEGRPDPYPSSRPPPLPPGPGPTFEQEPETKPGVGSGRKSLPSNHPTVVGMPAVRPAGQSDPPAAGAITRPLLPSGKPTQMGMVALRVPPAPAPGVEPVSGEVEKPSPAWPQATKGLVRWMRQSSLKSGEAAQRPRRRKGPMSAAQAEESLLASDEADEALAVFFDFAQQFFAYSALFVVQGDLAEGRDAYGPGADRDRVSAVGVTLDLPSCLAHARSKGAPVCVTLAKDGIDAALASDLGRSPKGSVAVVPVTVRRRVVALLYGDDGEASVELSTVGEVLSMASLTGAQLERMVVLRKRRKAGESDPVVMLPDVVVPRAPALPAELAPTQAAPVLPAQPPAQPPWPAAGSGGQAGPVFPSRSMTLTGIAPHGREQKAEALARALGITLAEATPASASPPTALSPEAPPPIVKAAPAPRRDPRAEPDDEAPSSTPELTVGEASVDDELLRDALASLEDSPQAGSPQARPPASRGGTYSGLGPSREAPPSSKAAYQPPRRPPSSTEMRALPAVIVDIGDELTRLVDQLVDQGVDDDELIGHVLREGVKLVPALVSRIPGRLRCTLESLLDGSTRPSAASAVLRALASLRRTALPFVVVQSANAQPGPRTYATLLLGELAYPESAAAVVPRFFDAETEARRAALAAARMLRASPELSESISASLERVVRDEREAPERRTVASRALADLEGAKAAPVLVSALRASDMRVREEASRVLADLTALDLGVDAPAWEAWLAQAGKADPTEWMIDALSHPSAQVRARAVSQLRPLMHHTLDGFESLPEQGRLEVQAQCRAIWKASDKLMRPAPRAD